MDSFIVSPTQIVVQSSIRTDSSLCFSAGSDSDVAQQTLSRRLRQQPNKNLTTYLLVGDHTAR